MWREKGQPFPLDSLRLGTVSYRPCVSWQMVLSNLDQVPSVLEFVPRWTVKSDSKENKAEVAVFLQGIRTLFSRQLSHA